eukprot:327577_1
MSTIVDRKYVAALNKDVVITYITETQAKEANFCNSNNHTFDDFDSYMQQNEQKQITKLEYHAEMIHTDYDRFVEYVSIQDAVNNPIRKMFIKPTECEELFDIAKIATVSGKIPLSRKDDFFYVLYTVIIREFPAHLFIHQPQNSDKYTHIIEEYLKTNSNADYVDIPFKYYDINKEYFIRLNECSPKDSRLGMGPFTNVEQMFESLICSCRARKALQKAYFSGIEQEKISVSDYNEIKNKDTDVGKTDNKNKWEGFGEGTLLWLIPWRNDIKSKNEFRCFVRENKLRAISQYVWYKDCGWINKQNILNKMCVDVQMLANRITQHIGHDQYVLDIHVLFDKDNEQEYKIEMIECNSFGAQLAAGAGCFHWIKDYNQLYGLREYENQIEVRIVCKDDFVMTSKGGILSSEAVDMINELLNIFE